MFLNKWRFSKNLIYSAVTPACPTEQIGWAAQSCHCCWEGRQVSAGKDGRKKQENGNHKCWDPALIHQGPQQVPGKELGPFCSSNRSSRTLSFVLAQRVLWQSAPSSPQHCCPTLPCALHAGSRPVPSCSRLVAESQTCSYGFWQKREYVTKAAYASQKIYFCIFIFDT